MGNLGLLSMKNFTSGIALIAMLSFVLFVTSASAQGNADEQERITLSPSSESFTVDAGTVRQGTMKIINDGDVNYDFNVYARPYSVNDEKYDPNFTEPKPNTNIYKWVQFEQATYHVEAGESVDVKYTIRVPENAVPGGHYGVLFAETKERELGSTGVARQKRVGKLIYATVNGEYKTGGQLSGFILPFWQTRAPLQSSVRVSNTGNADFRVKSLTEAKDLFGRTKFTYKGDPIVLPQTIRLVEMNWEKSPSFGIFKVNQKIEFLDQKHENNGYVLIAPRWFPMLFIGIILAGVAYAILSRRTSRR